MPGFASLLDMFFLNKVINLLHSIVLHIELFNEYSIVVEVSLVKIYTLDSLLFVFTLLGMYATTISNVTIWCHT